MFQNEKPLLRNFRVPDYSNIDIEREKMMKKMFVQFIKDEFIETNRAFEMTEDIKPKLVFCFNWIIGREINVYENKGLQFFGEIGLGKSCMMKAVVKMVSKLYPSTSARYITANKLASLFRYSDEQTQIEINRLIYCQLLFIDDIGTEDQKVYNSYPVQEIVRERYDRKRITSFTTNKISKELATIYSTSIEDKLSHGTYLLEFKGSTKRC